MPELDIAGIAGGALQGFLQGKNQAAQTQLQRAEFEHQKEQDRLQEERAKELQDWARETHGSEVTTAKARAAMALIDLGNAQDDQARTKAMRELLKAQGLSPEMVEVMKMTGELEEQKARIASSRASAGAAAASAEASRANTRGQNLNNQILEQELSNNPLSQELKRLTQLNSAGFDIDPRFAESKAQVPTGTLTNTPKGGAGTDPVSVQFKAFNDAHEMLLKNPKNETIKTVALIKANNWKDTVAIQNGVDPEKIPMITELDTTKPIDAVEIYKTVFPTGMFSGRELDPNLKQFAPTAIKELETLINRNQGTDAGTISKDGVANDPLAFYQPATVQLIDQYGIRDAVVDLTKKKGSALTPEELLAIKSEKDKAEKPAESAAPQTSIWGEIGSWFTSGADKNQKK